tara:strand:+ start:923 stop:1129 length:207 start_codon:yes stop_codon:yes gene_type:complete
MKDRKKLTFKHWKTGELITKIVVEAEFPCTGFRNIYWCPDEEQWLDVITETVVSLEEIDHDGAETKKG